MVVENGGQMCAGPNWQSATIGFQGAGGSSAAAYPLAFNGKILDDNLPESGWSVSPLPICGNGILEKIGRASWRERAGFTTLGGANNNAGVTLPSTLTI